MKVTWWTGFATAFAGVARSTAALPSLMVTSGAVLTVAHAHAGRPIEALRTVWRKERGGDLVREGIKANTTPFH